MKTIKKLPHKKSTQILLEIFKNIFLVIFLIFLMMKEINKAQYQLKEKIHMYSDLIHYDQL